MEKVDCKVLSSIEYLNPTIKSVEFLKRIKCHKILYYLVKPFLFTTILFSLHFDACMMETNK